MKELFKRLITDFMEKDLEVLSRNYNIPLDTQKIVSLIGVRRSGKTYILFDLIKKLREKGLRENIIYVNFEDDRLIGITYKNLDELIEAYFELFPRKREERIYIFLDEVQEVEYWEKFVRRIYDSLNTQIYITGSSSKLLSKEIATSLRGRTISYEIFPLSFKEFLDFKNIEFNLYSSKSLSFIKSAFNEYLIKGGFPEVVLEENEDIQIRILRDYVDLVVYRDIIERYHIKNLSLLKLLIKYIFSNPATLISFNKLYNDFKSMGYKLSKDTLFEYFEYLNDAYVAFTTAVFKSSVKEEVRNPKKVFIVDNGFNYIFDTSFSPDFSKLYENLVFLNLRRKYKDVYYFRQKREVDFYVPQEKLLINVSYDISSKETLKRELTALEEGMKYFGIKESYLITSEKEETITTNSLKIHLTPLWKWLVSKS
ncbi:ATP-binding protein [Persephonella sp. KM09-Lau-8]|uniref:ATP-binding protein n=1 Tax=Persephonella sp. KM09-Lau-8 TaxID=1158345 RepID=UPI0004965B63|nr:ATP-binding protein [Persephonella sp. KM09-Lau-8]